MVVILWNLNMIPHDYEPWDIVSDHVRLKAIGMNKEPNQASKAYVGRFDLW